VGGSDKKKTKTTYTPPSWIEGASQDAIGIGQRIAGQEYQAYSGQRVAPLSANERRGMSMAGTSSQYGQADWGRATAALDRGTQQFKDADMSDYMNPYIKGALDPVAREISEEGQRQGTAIDARAASMNAFSGSRAALAKSQVTEKTIQGISDMYGAGYAAAYESAVGIWGDERTRDMQAAGRFVELGQARITAADTDISTLMTTGATDRSIKQSLMDFDYQQFTEERDWDFRALSGLLAAIQGTKGSYSTEQTTTETTKKDNTAEIVGAIAQIVAAIYSDERLKDNITFIGMHMGHRIYTWTWNALAQLLGINTPTIGVLAQEVQHTGHVIERDGLLMVDYRSLFAGETS
jgi:hypothetical protein